MDNAKVQKSFVVLCVVLGLLILGAGIGVATGLSDGSTEDPRTAADRILWGLIGGLGGIMLLGGLGLGRRAPWVGGAFMVVGAAAVGAILVWTLFMPIVALFLAWFGVTRAKRFATENQGQA